MTEPRTRSFHEEIARNKRQSVFIIFVVALLWFAVGIGVGLWFGEPIYGAVTAVLVTGIQLVVILSAGDTIALKMMRAIPVSHSDEPRLHNVVEEMSIAAGQPMPKVYVIRTSALNAFATGMSPNTASIAVTRGLLETLNREELQGVVAHEMSHIRNYDIRVAVILAVMVGAIVMLSDFMLDMARWGRGSSRSDRGGQAQAVMMLIALVVAILAPLFAVMLQMAVSRKREYLADASAVELSRNPLALASALNKLTMKTAPRMDSPGKAFNHLFIVNPLKSLKQGSSLFDSHPATRDRVTRLEQMAYLYTGD